MRDSHALREDYTTFLSRVNRQNQFSARCFRLMFLLPA